MRFFVFFLGCFFGGKIKECLAFCFVAWLLNLVWARLALMVVVFRLDCCVILFYLIDF